MILVDSNILVYAINQRSPKSLASQNFIRSFQTQLCYSHQNVIETYRILTHPKFDHPLTSLKAISAIQTITDQLSLITPLPESFYLAVEYLRRLKLRSDQVFDAYLAATAITNSVTELATDNTKDFKIFSQLHLINPYH